MTEAQYVTQRDFNEFREAFIRSDAANQERQKAIDQKLSELLDAKKEGAERDNAQATLISDLNNTAMSQGQQIGSLRESRNAMLERMNKQDVEISNLKTERKVLNWVLGIGISIAIIASPIVSEIVGNWLTKAG